MITYKEILQNVKINLSFLQTSQKKNSFAVKGCFCTKFTKDL